MEPAHDMPWRPLGQLLIERGLITEAELEDALDEQALTDKPLGELLVKRGLLSGPDLTQALMEQLGVELTKEEGFGSGLWAAIKQRHPRGAEEDEGPSGFAEPEPEPQPSSDEPPPLVLVDQLYERLEAEGAEPSGGAGESLREELADLRVRAVALEAELEAERSARAAAEVEDELAQAERREDGEAASRLAEAEARLADERAGRQRAEERAEEAELRMEELAQKAEEAEQRAHQTARERDERLAEMSKEADEARRRAVEAERRCEEAERHGQQLAQKVEEAERRAQELEQKAHAAGVRSEQLGQSAEQAEQNAEQAEQNAEQLARQAEEFKQRSAELEQKLEQAEPRFAELGRELEAAQAHAAGLEEQREAERMAGVQALSGLEQALAELASRHEVLQQQRAEEREVLEEFERVRVEVDHRGACIASLESELEALRGKENEQRDAAAALAAHERELAVLGERIDATEERLRREREAHADTRRLLAVALEQLASGAGAAEPTGHLLFVPRAEGYDLIELDGPAPAPGVEIEHAETRFVVSKLGRSPLPLDRRPCAYLVAA